MYKSYEFNFVKDLGDLKSLLIVVAMESEEQAMLDRQSFETITIGNRNKLTLRKLSLEGRRIFLSRSGVGIAKAAMLTSQILDYLEIDAILMLGVGGALDDSLNVGDTVISRQIIQHDSVFTTAEASHFIAPGELTLSATADEQVNPVMKCDEKLVNWMRDVTTASSSQAVVVGTILSGSEFAADPQRKLKLRSLEKSALLVDMEAAAIAMVARNASIPFVTAKTVADRSNPKRSVSEDYVDFLSIAAQQSASVLSNLVEGFKKEKSPS